MIRSLAFGLIFVAGSAAAQTTGSNIWDMPIKDWPPSGTITTGPMVTPQSELSKAHEICMGHRIPPVMVFDTNPPMPLYVYPDEWSLCGAIDDKWNGTEGAIEAQRAAAQEARDKDFVAKVAKELVKP